MTSYKTYIITIVCTTLNLLLFSPAEALKRCPHLDTNDATHAEWPHVQFDADRYDMVNGIFFRQGSTGDFVTIGFATLQMIWNCEKKGKTNNTGILKDIIKTDGVPTIFSEAYHATLKQMYPGDDVKLRLHGQHISESLLHIQKNPAYLDFFNQRVRALSEQMRKNILASGKNNTKDLMAFFGGARFDKAVNTTYNARLSKIREYTNLGLSKLFEKSAATQKIILDEVVEIEALLYPFEPANRTDTYFRFIDAQPLAEDVTSRISDIDDAIKHIKQNGQGKFKDLERSLESHRAKVVDLLDKILERDEVFELLQSTKPNTADFRAGEAMLEEAKRIVESTGLVGCVTD